MAYIPEKTTHVDRYAVSPVTDTNKLLTEADGSASYKLLSPASGGGDYLYIPRPDGGSYSEHNGTNVGSLRVTLPSGFSNTMIMFHIDLFNYLTGGMMTFMVSGYLYEATTNWINYSSVQIGGNAKYTVVLGSDGTNPVVQIGSISETTLDHVKVTVRDFTAGYLNATPENFLSGWGVTRETALPTIVSATLNGGLDADTLDGYNSSDTNVVNTVVRRNSSGDINARLFRSEYDSTNATINFIMTQIDTASNNYIRPSTPAQLLAGLGFSASKITSGYQKLGGGVIIQWGLNTTAADTYINFPIAFPAACRSVATTIYDTAANYQSITIRAVTTTRFYKDGDGGTNGTYWIAIGY